MNKNSDAKVIVGMSGGVDSSVAALLLQQQGYDVSAVFMQNWDDDDEQCTTRQDYRDASAVCAKLDIELSTVNFEKEYWDRVFAHFLDEYSSGRTPNPDILCNKEIKFKAFLNHAQSLGCDYIATGHYAQRRVPTGDVTNNRSTEGIQMLRGVDSNKDQTYFLYTLGQKELANTLFPIGDRPKNEVRELAKNAGFHLFSKKDSTGICFIGERKFSSFLSEYLPATPGRMLTTDGRELGTHNGLMYYTIGQRQGLGIGGRSSSSDEPWYVLEKNVSDNELIVAQGHDHPLLYKSGLYCHDLHWCAGAPPSGEFSCSAKTRYRQQDQPARVEVPEQQSQTTSARVIFAEPVRALTPGQSIVFYDQEVCLGGAVISEAF